MAMYEAATQSAQAYRSWSKLVDSKSSHSQSPRNLRIYKLNSGLPRQELGTVGEVREAAEGGCLFCELLVDAVDEYSRTVPAELPEDGEPAKQNKVADDVSIHVSWEIDGHTRKGKNEEGRNVSRRLLISWIQTGVRKEAYIVYVPPQNPSLPNSDAMAEDHAHDHFFGRTIEASKGKQALIRSWIDKCDQGHSTICNPDVEYADAFKKLTSQNYFGVIDVIDMQLKSLPIVDRTGRPEKFVALSYVWESGETYTTQKSNVSTHLAHGGLESVLHKLPQVIQDTINLVQRLGLRYLWVDRLCIVQQSVRSWRLNAASMHLVYGQAYLTVCAADGPDARTGLLAMHPDRKSRQLIKTVAPGLKLLVSRPPEIVLQGSKWNSRGWTFQERLLSRRCLIFSECKVYFQCRSTGMSEDIQTDGKGLGWGLDSTNSPLQIFSQLERRSIWFYMICISLYTKRNLTFDRDVIAAFDGMSNVMERTMRAPFCFGLPTSHFDFALLWQPKGNLKRRIALEGHDLPQAEFPSWSWAGWQGFFCQYDNKELDGCLLDVNDWLLKHTWIRWYIRDENSNLRPLWNKNVSKADASLEKRWRGYKGVTSSDRELGYVAMPRQGIHDRGTLSGDAYHEEDDNLEPQEMRFNGEYHRRARNREELPLPRHHAQSPHPLSPYYEELPRQREARQSAESGQAELERRSAASIVGKTVSNPGSYLDNAVREEQIVAQENERSISITSMPNDGPPPAPRSLLTPQPAVADEADVEWLDDYGRSNRAESFKEFSHFTSYISEYPFGNRRPLPSPASATQLTDVPILQFFTWRKPLYVLPMEQNMQAKVESTAISDLQRCSIADASGDWCGSILLKSSFIENHSGHELQFIAISEAKDFTSEECPDWTYYVPSQRDESEWDLYFVLLIKRDPEKLIWERVALGKVYKQAFNGASWDEIKLG
jgi:hypothetical protein